MADTFHNVKYVKTLCPKQERSTISFLILTATTILQRLWCAPDGKKLNFLPITKTISTTLRLEASPGGNKVVRKGGKHLGQAFAEHHRRRRHGRFEQATYKAYDCDVSKVFKETAAVPKTVHAYAYIFKDIAPGEELYLNYYYGDRDERRQTAWVNGLDKKSDVYKYLLEDGEVDGIKFKDYWGMPVHDVLSNAILQGGWDYSHWYAKGMVEG